MISVPAPRCAHRHRRALSYQVQFRLNLPGELAPSPWAFGILAARIAGSLSGSNFAHCTRLAVTGTGLRKLTREHQPLRPIRHHERNGLIARPPVAPETERFHA